MLSTFSNPLARGYSTMHEGIIFCVRNVLNLDCGRIYREVYICQDSMNCAFKMDTLLLYINHTLVRLNKNSDVSFLPIILERIKKSHNIHCWQ
jgi:hypothetical protein